MNETQNPKPGRRMPAFLLAWLILLAALVVMVVAADLMPNCPRPPYFIAQQAVMTVVGATLLLGLWLFIRWSCQRRNLGRVLAGAALLVTLVALFYLEEDWRGQRAWTKFKGEMAAKGVELDWPKFIPVPVPDDQNFFTASSNILTRFKKAQGDAESNRVAQCSWLRIDYSTNAFPIFDSNQAKPLVVARITISPLADLANDDKSNDLALKLDAPETPSRVQDLIQKHIGWTTYGAAGFEFSQMPLSNLPPVRIRLGAEMAPSVTDLGKLIPRDLITNLGRFRIEATSESNQFRALLTDFRVTTAAEYLKWSDQFVPAFDEVRAALKRPYALLPGDYSDPVMIPIPSFLTLRSVCQTLAQRAQSDFLLDQPDLALHELTLVHDLCRILQRPPSGQPITLVESMMNVAIGGLYASTISDGLRLRAWREPQLSALQAQLKEAEFAPLVLASLRSEQAFATSAMINTSTRTLQKRFWANDSRAIWQRLSDPVYLFLIHGPRGWHYQNAVDHVSWTQMALQSCDPARQLIFPQAVDDWQKHINALSRWNPYAVLEVIYMPNLFKVLQTTARNQTQVNEAQIACALECYRLAHGDYPETLDSLLPQYIAELPRDVIGGQPLHYRRLENGKFLLYSVGWNGRDDGGQDSEDRTQGDWVWK